MNFSSVSANPLPTPATVPATVPPERTKTRLLEVVKRHGPQTAQHLAQKLEVSVPAARRHLIDLQEQQLIEARIERPGGRGRPQYVFALTERGEASFPKTYAGLCVGVLDHVHQIFGDGAVLKVLDSRNVAVAKELHAEIPAHLSLPERLLLLIARLNDMGFDAEAEEVEGQWFFTQRNCPNLAVARQYQELCASEITLYTQVLGVTISRETRIACGQGCCRYRLGQ